MAHRYWLVSVVFSRAEENGSQGRPTMFKPKLSNNTFSYPISLPNPCMEDKFKSNLTPQWQAPCYSSNRKKSTPLQTTTLGLSRNVHNETPLFIAWVWSLCFHITQHTHILIKSFLVPAWATWHIFVHTVAQSEHKTFKQLNTDRRSNGSETSRGSTGSSQGTDRLQKSKYHGSSSHSMLMDWPDCDHPQYPFHTELGRNQSSYRGMVPTGLAGG